MKFKDYVKVKEDTLNSIINEFLTHYSYKMLTSVQNARVGIEIYEYTKNNLQSKDRYDFKDKSFEVFDKKFCIQTDIKMIHYADRSKARVAKSLRNKILPLSVFNSTFNFTFDVYHNGIKIPRSEIEIVFSDFATVIFLPNKYKDFVNLYVVKRPYIYDKEFVGKTITITDISNYDTPFMVFVNGKYTKNFTKIINQSGLTINVNCLGTDNVELVFNNNIYTVYTIPKNTKNFKIAGQLRFPIYTVNIFSFVNGLFTDLNLVPRTGNVFTLNIPPVLDTDIVVFYNEEKNDINRYVDKVQWYDKKINDLVDTLNKGTEPEYIKKFKLSDIDITLKDRIESNIQSNLEYNDKKFKDIILYDYEFYNMYINKFLDGNDIYEKSILIDLKDFDLEKITVTDNTQDVDESLWMNFIVKHIKIKFGNKERYKFDVFVDGIVDFDYFHFNEAGESILYVKKDKVTTTSKIEIVITDMGTDISTMDYVVSNTNKLVINNESFVTNYKFLQCFTDVGGRYLPTDKVKSIEKINATTIAINFTENINGIVKVSNTFAKKVFKSVIRKYELYNPTIELPADFNYVTHNKNNFTIYKSGRIVPRRYFDIEFPSPDNTLSKIKITVKAGFKIAEYIHVEFMPYEYIEANYQELLDAYGELRIDKGILPAPLNRLIMNFGVNGRRLHEDNTDIWCNNGALIKDVRSRKHFEIVLNKTLFDLVKEYSETYNTGRDLFDEFVKTLLKGSLIDDKEEDMLKPDPYVMQGIYYQLYQEFLKHNIIDFKDPVPDYIAIKYSDITDIDDNMIFIDVGDTMRHWMPLDPLIDHSQDQLVEILDKYYKLLDDIEQLKILDANDIPPEIYEQYKELFDNNVLVLHIPGKMDI